MYRALNWGTGETVAVKQVRLADLPKSELRVIMVCQLSIAKGLSCLNANILLQLEIDLLKNLNV